MSQVIIYKARKAHQKLNYSTQFWFYQLWFIIKNILRAVKNDKHCKENGHYTKNQNRLFVVCQW